MNKKGSGDWILTLTVVMVLIFLATILFIEYYTSNEACEDFGGKLSGQMNCIKNGVSYDLENKGIFTMEKQVVRKAVDINRDAFVEVDE